NRAKPFIDDDVTEIPFAQARPGDIVSYRRNKKLKHSGIVEQVSNGIITEVRSKWGAWRQLSMTFMMCIPRMGGLKSCVDQMVPDSNHSDDQSRQSKMNREETVRNALESISRPEVHYQVLLASTPDVAMDIVEMLPGVKELVALGPEAEEAALSLLKTEKGISANNRATIGLYLLHHINTPRTTRALADAVSKEQFKGINKELAASAFLRSAGFPA